MDGLSVSFYEIWVPDTRPITVLFTGDWQIYERFSKDFSQFNVSNLWTPTVYNQRMFQHGFYVGEATGTDIPIFKSWFNNFVKLRPISLKCDGFDCVWALSFHTDPVSDIMRQAKPYGAETANKLTQQSGRQLADALNTHFGSEPWFKSSDFLVAVPCSVNKSFDLPNLLTEILSELNNIPNGSGYLNQVREKRHSQKDLSTKVEKQENVKGLFGIAQNHPFSGKTVTIVDDIYHSGVTITELAHVLRDAGAAKVQGLVVTKTLRD